MYLVCYYLYILSTTKTNKSTHESAFIDPLSIIGVLFLIVTLAVGTAVTTNKQFSLNISEYAREIEDKGNYVAPKKSVEKNKDNDEENNDSPNVPEIVSPPATVTAAPTTSGYDFETAKNNTATENTAGFDKGGGEISGYYKSETNGLYYAIGGTGNDPNRYNEGVVAEKRAEINDSLAAVDTNLSTTQTTSNSISAADLENIQREQSQCLQDGGFWKNNSCSYDEQEAAVTEITKVIQDNKDKHYECLQGGGQWSTTRNSCSYPEPELQAAQEIKTNFFSSWFSNSNQPDLPDDFNPQLSAISMAGGQSSQLNTEVCSGLTSNEYQNCINELLIGTEAGNNTGIIAALTVPAIIYAPAIVSAATTSISEITALAGTGGYTLASFAQASASYGSAAIAALPTSVQAVLTYGGSALTIGGTAVATADCINSNDPNSPACMGLVTGYQADPIGFNEELSSSANTLNQGTRQLLNNIGQSFQTSLIPLQTQSTVAYEFYGADEVATFQSYVDDYGAPPETINLKRDPKILYNFQSELINGSTPNGISTQTIKNSLVDLQNQNVTIHVLSPEQLSSQFGEGVAGACRYGQCRGIFGIGSKRTADVFISDITGYSEIFNVSRSDAALIAAQKLGHEGGHALDWIELGLGPQREALWATEFRQKYFNMEFYNAIGEVQASNAYKDFLNGVIQASTVYFK